MPIYFHGISISNVLITHNKKRPWKFWQNAELNGCVRRVEKNNRAILLGRKCCVHLYAWVPISAKGELPCHSTTTFAPFHYLITHALCSFLICMVISLSLSLSIMKMAMPILFHVLTFLFVVMDQWGIDMCNLIFFFFKLYIITCNWIFNLFISIQIHPLKIWLMHAYKDTIQLEMDPRGPDPVLRFFFFFFFFFSDIFFIFVDGPFSLISPASLAHLAIIQLKNLTKTRF